MDGLVQRAMLDGFLAVAMEDRSGKAVLWFVVHVCNIAQA
jgi:hypothetical protein